jgi:transposase
MKSEEWNLTNEQVNDLPLLLGIMEGTGIRRHIDEQMVQHGGWDGISLGTMIEIWLAYMLTEQDHRLVAVREWVQDRRQVLNELLGIELRATDLSDDRLARVLGKLGDERVQRNIDTSMVQDWIIVYELPHDTIRLDSTSVSVYSPVGEDNDLIQRGHSKDHRPDLGQFKVMLSSLDPLGMPLNCAVVSGQQADDGLYGPIYDQTVQTLGRRDVLVVGDSKMAALATRGHIVKGGSAYLCSYRPAGNSSTLTDWTEQALGRRTAWQVVTEVDPTTGEIQTVAVIDEWIRSQVWPDPLTAETTEWPERVLVVRSEQMHLGLIQKAQERLARLSQALDQLRRAPGRGRKRYATRANLQAKVESLLKQYDLVGLVTVTLAQDASVEGPTRWIVGSFVLNQAAWAAHCERLGWTAYLTNTTPAQYDTPALLWNYRHQVVHERSFSRLKTRRLNIRPVYLRDEQRIVGLTWLLCLALKILTLTEFRLRTALQRHNEPLVGLNPAVPSQATTHPTTERILQVFRNLTFTVVQIGTSVRRHMTPLSETQQYILTLLDLPPDLYARLADMLCPPLPSSGWLPIERES